jgi:predicted metal-dependent hydrolase
VIPSRRRRRTVQALLVGGVLELRVPEAMPPEERSRWAERMRARIERQIRRAQPSDAVLEERARELNLRYVDGRLHWASVGYAAQQRRWGSCTTTAGVIRVSSRAAALPRWVRDYILVHELVHLEVPGHGARFWALVNRYPLAERARGFLIGFDAREDGDLAGRPP